MKERKQVCRDRVEDQEVEALAADRAAVALAAEEALAAPEDREDPAFTAMALGRASAFTAADAWGAL